MGKVLASAMQPSQLRNIKECLVRSKSALYTRTAAMRLQAQGIRKMRERHKRARPSPPAGQNAEL